MSHQRYKHHAPDDTLIVTDSSGDQLIVRRNGDDVADGRFAISTNAAHSEPYETSAAHRRSTPAYIEEDDLRAILEFLKEKLA